MKITIYELLGMIKDGKAPKKIKFDYNYCYYRECKNEYVDFTNKPIIQWDYVVMNCLNEEVEIIEEPQIPEKLDIQLNSDDENKVNYYRATNLECDLAFKINEILELLEEIEND